MLDDSFSQRLELENRDRGPKYLGGNSADLCNYSAKKIQTPYHSKTKVPTAIHMRPKITKKMSQPSPDPEETSNFQEIKK